MIWDRPVRILDGMFSWIPCVFGEDVSSGVAL
jgi:Gly-Xaa carboxypeptidase